MPLSLFVLAVSAFAIGSAEFVTTGLLQTIAADLQISITHAGMMTSGYALGVVVSAPLLTWLSARANRKHTLLLLLVLFIAGNIISSLADNLEILMVGRILAACCHGAFFGIGAVVATRMVEADKQASAIALMFTGLTLANVLGVPAGTWLGQHYGWRSAFQLIALLGGVGLVGLCWLLPNQQTEQQRQTGELAVFRRPEVWLALLITASGFGGLLASFAYISPMMTEISGFSITDLSLILVVYGLGLVSGNLVAARFANHRPEPVILVLLTLLVALLLLFYFTLHIRWLAVINVFMLGAVGFGTVPPLQMYVLQKAYGAPALASAANISAFNLGAAGGVMLGGQAIDAGFGLASPNLAGALLSGTGLIIALCVMVSPVRRRR
ncbi:arabinose transporter permease [Tatumella morbirosei]|uniref:Arabinose transporter permease n=1 Tax=Tatumella morbirosei TaxID=642227 RepID=A0A095T5H3_9GAMM|nr:MFS transporter [Tatumella morbirosei]KGD71947.1 arabinose transporter permease [Tatumella morbirosei]